VEVAWNLKSSIIVKIVNAARLLAPGGLLLRKTCREVVREEHMKLDALGAVVKAADEWVSAQEALVAAKQVSDQTEAEREAVDIAGSRLVVMVNRWRSTR
jgi:hypothetical protein